MFPPDVASEEQQKPILPVNEDNEETVSEDLAMETEDHTAEELKTSEVEKLNPEAKMSGTSKSGKSSTSCLENSFFKKYLPACLWK